MCGIWALIKNGQLNQSETELYQLFQTLAHRGPDDHEFTWLDNSVLFGFHRLSIIDLSDKSNQPLHLDQTSLICNGEIYNYQSLAEQYQIDLKTGSDCEIILPLYQKYGILSMVQQLDAEFALIIYDQSKGVIQVARDPFGVRPLYYGVDQHGNLYFSSEATGLSFLEQYQQFPPGCYLTIKLGLELDYYQSISREIRSYFQLSPYYSINDDYQTCKQQIRQLLIKSVQKRLMSDRPLGCLLSGGVDSSLTTAIALRMIPQGEQKLHCFTIGMNDESVDVIAARKVANYLGIQHHHVIHFTEQEGFEAIREVIQHLATYDVTTIRASTPQYLMAKYIQKKTDIRALISGEGSDELFASYQYFKKATNPYVLYGESCRLLTELHFFDNLRTDRTMSGASLEVRVPFLDQQLVNYVTGINSYFRLCHDRMEKSILREAFSPENFTTELQLGTFINPPTSKLVDRFLPDEILFRSKEAFSDAVSCRKKSWYQSLVEKIEQTVSDQDLIEAKTKYQFNPPPTREALYYRQIFEQLYPGGEKLIPHYWMPRWVDLGDKWDPSATVLDCHEGDLSLIGK